MTAPRVGPLIRSHVTGGPEWRTRFFFIPGMVVSAVPMPMSTGFAAMSRLTASWLAWAISGRSSPSGPKSLSSALRIFTSPPAVGFQSTCRAGVPARRRLSANEASPRLMTESLVSKSSVT